MKRFIQFTIVLLLFTAAVVFLIEGGGVRWQGLIAIILSTTAGVLGHKYRWGRL